MDVGNSRNRAIYSNPSTTLNTVINGISYTLLLSNERISSIQTQVDHFSTIFERSDKPQIEIHGLHDKHPCTNRLMILIRDLVKFLVRKWQKFNSFRWGRFEGRRHFRKSNISFEQCRFYER